jgi:glycosyltransferase involved in cell wall biosynthesis
MASSKVSAEEGALRRPTAGGGKTMASLVTICMPTYNRGPKAARTVESLLAQTFADFTLILVDDSTDRETEAFADTLRDHRVRYVRNPERLGMTGNWNRCLELALAEGSPFLAIFHDDDFYHPGMLSAQVSFMQAHSRAGMVYPACVHDCPEEGHSSLRKPWDENRLVGWDELMSDICAGGKHNNITTPGMLLRREACLKAGFFDVKYKICPDLDYWWRILEEYEMGYLAESLMTIRIHGGQVSSGHGALENALTQNETFMYLSAAIGRHSGIVDIERVQKGIRNYCAGWVMHALFRHLGDLTPADVQIAKGALGNYGWTAKRRVLYAIFSLMNHRAGKKLFGLALTLNRWRRSLKALPHGMRP